jgi:hypothetical protein
VVSQIPSIRWTRAVPVLFSLVVLAATVALKLGVGTSQAAVSSTMHAVVREDNTIGLTFDDGSPVGSQARETPTIPAGTYTVRVQDAALEHNFHLVGPGVDVGTPVDATASPTWTVTFQAGGVYRFVCDTHTDFMYGLFQAVAGGAAGGGTSGGGGSSGGTSGGGGSSGGSGGSSGGGATGGSSGGKVSTGSGGTQAIPLRGTLAGTVGADGKPKLLFKGKAVSRLKAGRYRVTIVDRSRTQSLLLQQAKRPAITLSGGTFTGTRSTTVTLKVGQWTFFTPAGKKSARPFAVFA